MTGRFLKKRGGILLLLLLPVCFLFFKGSVNPGTNFMWNDFIHQDYPWQAYIDFRFSQLEIPYWNPYQSAGMAFTGSWQHRIFYPPRLILHFFLGPEKGIFAELVLALYIALIGVFALLRYLKLHQLAASGGALLFFLYSVGWIDWNTPVLSTLCWLPWLTLCALHLTDRLQVRTALDFAVLFALAFLGGAAQWLYYTIEFIALLLITQKIRRFLRKEYGEIARLVLLESLAGVVFIMLILGQLEGVYEAASQGPFTKSSLTYVQFRSTDVNLWNPFELLQMRTLFVDGVSEWIALATILASILLAFRLKRRRTLLGFMLFCFVYYYLATIGETTPFSKLYFNMNPLGSQFRMPKRMGFLFIFSCAMFLGVGLQSVILAWRHKQIYSPGTGPGFLQRLIAISKSRNGFWLRMALGLLLLTPLFLFFDRKAIELTYLPPYEFPQYVRDFRSRLLTDLKMTPQDRFEIICNFEANFCQNAGMLAQIPQLNSYDRMGTYRSYLYQNQLSVNHEPDPKFIWIGDYYILGKEREINFNLYRLAGVQYIFSRKDHFEELKAQTLSRHNDLPLRKVEGFQLQDPIAKFLLSKHPDWVNQKDLAQTISEKATLGAYKLEGTLPRIFLHNSFTIAQSPAEAAALMDSKFDPRVTLIVEGKSELIDRLAKMKKDQADVMRPGKFTSYSSERVEIEVESRGQSIMVLTDQFFPGWKAHVDGIETEILPVDLLYRGVVLNPGKHTVLFTYNPILLKICIVLSLLTWLSLIGLIGFSFRPFRRN
ncbi:MAG: YfhO family protein [Spirochaetia bacterium]|nr:YfhO family protein [Spirochaetia bacterium]